MTSPNRYWSVSRTAQLNVFDSGKHNAELDAASGNYRPVALAAFEEVENNLSRLKFTRLSTSEQETAAAAAHKTMTLAMNRYREVVTAQEAALSAEEKTLDLHTQQLLFSVDLIH